MKLEILCAGIGGRGVLLASTVLIEAAIAAGLHAIASDEYGMSQRGGSVVSLVKVGEVESPLVGREGASILLAFEESEFYRNLPYLKREGMAIINTDKTKLVDGVARLIEKRDISYHMIDTDRIAAENGMVQASNMARLGYFSQVGPELFDAARLEETIRSRVPSKVLEKNMEIFRIGCNMAIQGAAR